MLIWRFSMDPDMYNDVGKLPKQHFNVWLFSNPGEKDSNSCCNFMKPGSQSGTYVFLKIPA